MHVRGSRDCEEGTYYHQGTGVFVNCVGMNERMETYSTGDLDLVVNTASVRMIVCLILHIRL